MALYSTFGEMLTQLRAEARLSTNPAVGASANDRYKAILNRVYENLYRSYEWPHLKYVAPRIQLQAGQRFYDFPAAVNHERLTSVTTWNGPTEYPISPGIGSAEYAQFDSVGDVRFDPPMRYDLRSTAPGATQIEIWPVPASGDFKLEITGVRKCPKLVNSADICLLESNMVVLFAASDLLAAVNKDDSQAKLSAAKQFLIDVRSNTKLPDGDGSAAPRIGLGGVSVNVDNGRAVVRVR